MYRAGERFKFGRGAEKQQRGQTRHLFYLVTIELLKDCFIAAGITSTNRNITDALLKLFFPSSIGFRALLLNELE